MGELVRAVPPLDRATATVYVATDPPTAVNVNDVPTTVSAGVVSVAVDVSVKSDQITLNTGCAVTVHTMFAEL